MGKHSAPFFTRKTSDPDYAEAQAAVGRHRAKPLPKIKEKRLVNGKWTRDYGEAVFATPIATSVTIAAPPTPITLTPTQQRMREVAARLKARKEETK